MDAEDSGFAAGLSNAVTRDGQGKMAVDFLPNSDNTLNLGSAIRRWATLNGVPVSNLINGGYTPQTAAEAAALVTPSNFNYQPWRGEDVRRIGATGNGTNDDRAALFAANSIGSSLFFPPGTYKISSNLTFTVPLILDYGAIIKPDAGVTVTINAPVIAGPWQIFNEVNAGAIIAGLIRPVNAAGRMYFEWWGAVGDNATDDTVACQATLRAASTANYCGIQMLPKQYRLTAMLNANGSAAQSVKAPSIYGVDSRISQFTTTTASIYLLGYAGGSGTNCGTILENIGFSGVSTDIGIKINGQCGLRFRRCFFDTLATGIHFYNLAASTFSEFNVAESCEWSLNCANALLYQVGAGTNSFHGSGSVKGIMTTNTANQLVQIGAGCRPYHAPLDGQVFYANSPTLFANSSALAIDFVGQLTTENLGGGTLTLGTGGVVPFVGTISCSQQNVLGGTLVQSQAMVTNSNTVQTFLGGRKAYQTAITTGANTLSSSFFNQHRLVFLRFLAAGYDFRYLLTVDANGGGAVGTQATITNHLATNTAGYGAPVFTVNTAGNLVATQAGWPASGVTCYWSEQCICFGNETLEVAQI